MENEMDEYDFQYQIDRDILRLIRIKSRQLAGKYGFASFDADDIQQDLVLDYLKRSPSFNAHRCNRRTFTRLVVSNCVATIIAARKASRRDYRVHQLSLNQRLDRRDPNSLELGEILIDPPSRAFEAGLNIAMDVDRLLARLPTGLADLCRSIMAC